MNNIKDCEHLHGVAFGPGTMFAPIGGPLSPGVDDNEPPRHVRRWCPRCGALSVTVRPAPGETPRWEWEWMHPVMGPPPPPVVVPADLAEARANGVFEGLQLAAAEVAEVREMYATALLEERQRTASVQRTLDAFEKALSVRPSEWAALARKAVGVVSDLARLEGETRSVLDTYARLGATPTTRKG